MVKLTLVKPGDLGQWLGHGSGRVWSSCALQKDPRYLAGDDARMIGRLSGSEVVMVLAVNEAQLFSEQVMAYLVLTSRGLLGWVMDTQFDSILGS